MFVGYALAWQAPAAVLPVLPLLPIYHRRITAEERLLDFEFGDAYAAYRQRTDRLLPGCW